MKNDSTTLLDLFSSLLLYEFLFCLYLLLIFVLSNKIKQVETTIKIRK